jgi:tetratricopeptide (TPR) repeat protein/transglutaminase-like putative cysteine protease
MEWRSKSILFSVVLAAALSHAQTDISRQPAFSASPKALLSAFDGTKADDQAVTVLLEENLYDFDGSSRFTGRHRMIFKVWNKAGAEGWAMVRRNWSPWEQERPTVRARVIAPDGTVHEFDPATIADSPVRDGDDDVLTDRRMIKAPLPALEPGSVVEQEITERQTAVQAQGLVRYFYAGAAVPTQQTRMVIRSPEGLPLRYKVRLMPDISVNDRKDGATREISFDQGALAPLKTVPVLLPSDEPAYPYIAFSTGQDWKTVATGYAAIVDKQIKGFNAASYLPKFSAGASREAKIGAIIDKLNREIRYTGIEFGESSITPHTPAEVIDHKYGDCKDKSALLVTLLRAAGIDAHIALLLSSTGEDIEPDLPGLGGFDHAIVYVPGTPDIWLDPTDPDLRLGVVSPPNQGRNALVARAQTTSLIRTPVLTPEENRIVETREFVLTELGRAKVTETSATSGAADRQYRGDFGDRESKELTDSVRKYVEDVYGEAKIAKVSHSNAEDLNQPFSLKIEMEDVQRGFSGRTDAVVAILVSQIASRLPNFFHNDPKDDKTPEPERKQDFVLPQPFVNEWRYRIVAPPGFKIRQLPEASDEKLGPARLETSFTRDSDLQVSAMLRFTSPGRRFSAADGLQLRNAVLELGKRKAILVYFDQVGETYLAAGKVREALGEFDRLRKLHPADPLHALQSARAMLAAGAGQSARAEARRAVALDPTSSSAYVQLAEVLKHDIIGRPMENGYDRDGAVEAYRKALELNPADNESRANLAILLEYNAEAVRYAPGARLAEALAEYEKILDKLESLKIPQNYPLALLRAERYAVLGDYLRKQPDSELNQALLLCAEGALNGSKAAVERVPLSGASRPRVLASAGQNLLVLGKYDLSADFFEAAAVGSPNSAAVMNLVTILRKVKPLDDVSSAPRPEDAVRRMLVRLSLPGHEKNWMEVFSSHFRAGEMPDYKTISGAVGGNKAGAQSNGMSAEALFQVGDAAIQYSREGDDAAGYVVRFATPGATTASETRTSFVVKEGSDYRVLATMNEWGGVGRLILEEADQSRLAEAKTWLDRTREEIPTAGGDDPLGGPAFPRLWQPGQAPTLSSVRVAAAALLLQEKTPIAMNILERALPEADDSHRPAILLSLTTAYYNNKEYAKSLESAQALLKAFPRSVAAVGTVLRAAYRIRKEQADTAFEANLPGFVQNVNALRSFAVMAMRYGDTTRSNALNLQIVNSGRANANDYNQLAWGDVMAGTVTPKTLEWASQGMLLSNNKSTGLMHTLAAVEVELGKEAEARAALLQRLKLQGTEPGDEDWYVFGRIAEQYGLTSDVILMYRKSQAPNGEFVAPTSYALAQRRLKALGAQ